MLDAEAVTGGEPPLGLATCGRRPPLLIWDCDGTLVDSWAAIRVTVNAALGMHGLGPADDVILRSSVGLSLDRIFGRLLEDRERDRQLVDALVAAYRTAFRTLGYEQTRAFLGVTSLLAEMRWHGAVSVVATSMGRQAVRSVLERLGIAGHVSGLMTDDDVARHQRKPHPEMVLRACRSYGYDPTDAVVIGDTVFDVEMGRAAGADTIAVTWGNQPRCDLWEAAPTHIVHEVDELGSLLGSYVGRAPVRQLQLRP